MSVADRLAREWTLDKAARLWSSAGMADVKLHPDWLARIGGEFDQPYMAQLRAFLGDQRAILGQDPYHGPGQAHGLCFSVQPGGRTPPSLVNIYKEMASDLGIPPARHGYLKHWAEQGVLLLNNVLTVESGQAASHQGKGWEKFTDAAVAAVAADPAPKVFILWGSHAQRKAANVPGLGADGPHLILRAPHPSPLSAHNGFFGSRPFSQANAFLEAHGRGAIDWRLPDPVDPPAA